MIVMITAITPSLKASKRSVSVSLITLFTALRGRSVLVVTSRVVTSRTLEAEYDRARATSRPHQWSASVLAPEPVFEGAAGAVLRASGGLSPVRNVRRTSNLVIDSLATVVKPGV